MSVMLKHHTHDCLIKDFLYNWKKKYFERKMAQYQNKRGCLIKELERKSFETITVGAPI